MLENKSFLKWKPMVICGLFTILVTGVFICIFALVINFADIDLKYSPVFASISVALGVLTGSYYLSSKKGNKGFLTGLCIGGIAFIIITLVGLIINQGGIGINTLFHLIITVLSGIIGGVLGVNKRPKKYI